MGGVVKAIGGIFGGDEPDPLPPPPPPPAAPPPPPTAQAPEGQVAAEAARKKARTAGAQSATIATGPEGLVATATTTRKSLLGE